MAINLPGCADPSPLDLVDNEAWTVVPDGQDPFVSLSTEERSCNALGLIAEEGVFEIQTERCPWATVTQSLSVDLHVGDELTALVFHGALGAPESAVGRTLVQLGDVVLLDQSVDIPSATALYEPTIVLDVDIDAGSAIYWHVHNHGGNSWRLGHVRWANAPASAHPP